MGIEFEKMNVKSLKEIFVNDIENKIISGILKPGDRLPPERDMAKQLGISRSVINSGILELASKGFIKIVPRKGSFITDYMSEGTLGILSALLHHLGEDMEEKLFIDTNAARRALEMESARTAAVKRSAEDLEILTGIIDSLKNTRDPEKLIALNMSFHYRLAIASGNSVLCILLRSFDDVIQQVLKYFFTIPGAIEYSRQSHIALMEAIKKSNSADAVKAVKRIFEESEEIYTEYRKSIMSE